MQNLENCKCPVNATQTNVFSIMTLRLSDTILIVWLIFNILLIPKWLTWWQFKPTNHCYFSPQTMTRSLKRTLLYLYSITLYGRKLGRMSLIILMGSHSIRSTIEPNTTYTKQRDKQEGPWTSPVDVKTRYSMWQKTGSPSDAALTTERINLLRCL